LLLLAVVQLVVHVPVVVVVGACQKSPHPAPKPIRSGAATNNSFAHFPGFIAAPY
jgi:hypothetical protein